MSKHWENFPHVDKSVWTQAVSSAVAEKVGKLQRAYGKLQRLDGPCAHMILQEVLLQPAKMRENNKIA